MAIEPDTLEYYHKDDELINNLTDAAICRLQAAHASLKALVAASRVPSDESDHRVWLCALPTGAVPGGCCGGPCSAEHWSGRWRHVELWFPRSRLAFTAIMDSSQDIGLMARLCCLFGCGGRLDCCCGWGERPWGTVMYVREFTNPDYQYWWLQLNQYWLDRLFLAAVDERDKPFSVYGSWRAFLGCCQGATDDSAHFCSSAIWAAILSSGILRYLTNSWDQDIPHYSYLAGLAPGTMTAEAVVRTLGALGARAAPGNHIIRERALRKTMGLPPKRISHASSVCDI